MTAQPLVIFYRLGRLPVMSGILHALMLTASSMHLACRDAAGVLPCGTIAYPLATRSALDGF